MLWQYHKKIRRKLGGGGGGGGGGGALYLSLLQQGGGGGGGERKLCQTILGRIFTLHYSMPLHVIGGSVACM